MTFSILSLTVTSYFLQQQSVPSPARTWSRWGLPFPAPWCFPALSLRPGTLLAPVLGVRQSRLNKSPPSPSTPTKQLWLLLSAWIQDVLAAKSSSRLPAHPPVACLPPALGVQSDLGLVSKEPQDAESTGCPGPGTCLAGLSLALSLRTCCEEDGSLCLYYFFELGH